VNRGDFSS